VWITRSRERSRFTCRGPLCATIAMRLFGDRAGAVAGEAQASVTGQGCWPCSIDDCRCEAPWKRRCLVA